MVIMIIVINLFVNGYLKQNLKMFKNNSFNSIAITLGSRISPAFAASLFLHGLIFLLMFVGFSSSKSNSVNFMPIGIEIGEFKAGSYKKQIAKKSTKQEFAQEISKNGDRILNKENIASKNLDTQKSRILKYNSYVELIAHELEKRKSRFNFDSAPDDVKVTIIFEVDLDETGNIKSYKVVKNSGIKYFDKIATKILTAGRSFPNPPAEIKSMGLTFSIPIIFDSLG